jgi:glycosyltransferase involved in cell wall biosynthesis
MYVPTNKLLTLSIIIPVYNEQSHLKDCLNSISNQTFKADEVIVVDNNSTDNSVKIAKKYKFVKVINEPNQGMTLAINRGLNEAKSNILARIDADASLNKDWIKIVKTEFSNDTELAGLSGLGVNTARSIYANPTISKFFCRMYFWNMRGFLGIEVLWGSNMAIARQAWLKIKDQVCLDDKIVHEDQDLSLLLASIGGKIKLNPRLLIKFDGSKLQNWETLREYMHRRKTTKKYHIARGTFESLQMNKLPLYQRWFFRAITAPADLLFHVTGIFYTPRAKRLIKLINRQ